MNNLIWYVCQVSVARKTDKHSPLIYILMQVVDGNCIFNNSLAKFALAVQGIKVGKHTPLKSGGLGGAWSFIGRRMMAERNAYPCRRKLQLSRDRGPTCKLNNST